MSNAGHSPSSHVGAPSLTASAIVARQAVSGSHILTIDGYSAAKGLGCGNFITSRPCGSYEFVRRSDLERAAHVLKDDAFSIRCDITVWKQIITKDVSTPADGGGNGVKKEKHGV